jgi:uncharacterized membrane protein YuzA (DUF378 family)
MKYGLEGAGVQRGVPQWSGSATAADALPDRVGEGYQLPLCFSATWDPYEVWRTRVCPARVRANIAVQLGRGASGLESTPAPGDSCKTPSCRTRGCFAFVWPALLLAIVLGLNRELVGMFRIDLVALYFGVMTPAARAVHVLLGIATMYCAAATIVLVRRCALGGNPKA